jgi:hypothetical protein
MAFSQESEKILEAAVAGIRRVANTIAEIPIEFRERALEAAERSYQQTVRDLGYSEADAQPWVSAVMFRLRGQVAELEPEDPGGSEPDEPRWPMAPAAHLQKRSKG